MNDFRLSFSLEKLRGRPLNLRPHYEVWFEVCHWHHLNWWSRKETRRNFMLHWQLRLVRNLHKRFFPLFFHLKAFIKTRFHRKRIAWEVLFNSCKEMSWSGTTQSLLRLLPRSSLGLTLVNQEHQVVFSLELCKTWNHQKCKHCHLILQYSLSLWKPMFEQLVSREQTGEPPRKAGSCELSTFCRRSCSLRLLHDFDFSHFFSGIWMFWSSMSHTSPNRLPKNEISHQFLRFWCGTCCFSLSFSSASRSNKPAPGLRQSRIYGAISSYLHRKQVENKLHHSFSIFSLLIDLGLSESLQSSTWRSQKCGFCHSFGRWFVSKIRTSSQTETPNITWSFPVLNFCLISGWRNVAQIPQSHLKWLHDVLYRATANYSKLQQLDQRTSPDIIEN